MANKYQSMLNNGTSTLECILDLQKTARNKISMGCNLNNVSKSPNFIPESKARTISGKKDTKRCHFCRNLGPIEKHFPELLQKYRKVVQPTTSRHVKDMTAPTQRREPTVFRKYPQAQEDITILIGEVSDMVSNSQICDWGLTVKFTREKCKAFDKFGECILEGDRLSNNCYLQKTGRPSITKSCLLLMSNKIRSWHEILGHKLRELSGGTILEECLRSRNVQIWCLGIVRLGNDKSSSYPTEPKQHSKRVGIASH